MRPFSFGADDKRQYCCRKNFRISQIECLTIGIMYTTLPLSFT